MTREVINMTGRGARGESFGDVARRVGTFAGLPVPAGTSDADILNLITAGIALTGANVYPNTAAGLAAVANGESFWVADADGLRLYLDNAGVADEIDPFTSAARVGFDPGAIGDTGRTVESKLRDTVSVFDFIPPNLIADIVAGTSVTDVSAYIQAADDHLGSLNGGDGAGNLIFPAGQYRLNATINKNMWVSWRGAGVGCTLEWASTFGTGAGVHPGIRVNAGLNGGDANPIVIERMALVHLGGRNAAGTRIGIYDTGSHNPSFYRLGMEGWKYDFVCDQTEIASFIECECSGFHNYWFVNTVEAELVNTGSLSSYTNGNKIVGGNMSPAAAGYGIIHDGGELFTVDGVNCNSGTFIRAAGISNLRISNCYLEGNAGSPIILAATSLNGAGVGQCSAVRVEGNLCGLGAFPFINVLSAGFISMMDNVTSGSGAPWIGGAENATGIWTQGNAPAGGRELLNAAPTFFQDVGEKALWTSTTYNPPSLAAGAKTTIQTLAFAGVTVANWGVSEARFSVDLAGARIQAWVSAADTISYYFINENGANPLDLGSGTVSFLLKKKY